MDGSVELIECARGGVVPRLVSELCLWCFASGRMKALCGAGATQIELMWRGVFLRARNDHDMRHLIQPLHCVLNVSHTKSNYNSPITWVGAVKLYEGKKALGFGRAQCVCCACRTQYDGIALYCLLSLLY